MQLLPIKLVPGYIAIDFVAGCIDCNFCVAKRDASIKKLFKSGRRYDLCGSEQVYFLLNRMPSFNLACIPLRIGNDTDYVFQKVQIQKLIEELPDNYPIVVLTRFPLSQQDVQFFNGRPNVLLKITITPYSSSLYPNLNVDAVTKSLTNLACKHVVTFGPIVADNVDGCIKLLKEFKFSKNSYAYLKALDYCGLHWLNHIKAADESSIALAKEVLDDKKVRHLTMILCPLFEQLERGDPRVVDIPEDEKENCLQCNSYRICYKSEVIEDKKLRQILNVIGIDGFIYREKIGYKTICVDPGCKTAIGDEAFVSYMLGQKVRFTNTIKGLFDEEIASRWSRCGFFPLDEIQELTRINSEDIE